MNQRSLAAATIAAVAAIAVVAVLWYAFGASRQLKNASQAPVVSKAVAGQPAPEFAVPTTAGYFDLNTVHKPVFLEVFATWCPHCQRETAVIDRLFAKYKNRVGFVGVSGSDTGIDGTSASSQLDVLNWAKRFNARYPVAYDGSLDVAQRYLQGGFPTLVVIGKNKNVAYSNSGEIAYADLAAAIEKALP